MSERRIHQALPCLRQLRITVAMFGCGGNGSRLAVELKNIALSLLAWRGAVLDVTLIDPDTVSAANLTRQSFYPSDVGHNKAEVLAQRINRSTGLNWRARRSFTALPYGWKPDIVITCVDSVRARGIILAELPKNTSYYHLDLGNDDCYGQVLIGTMHLRGKNKIPPPNQQFPDLFDASAPPDDAPSCGTIEALARQDLSTNLFVVAAAHNLLWRLLKDQQLEHQAYFCNIKSGVTAVPITIDQRSRRAAPRARAGQGTPQP
jgi:sulfur-carrier protein adenylyltransferase/sulfurtransferase